MGWGRWIYIPWGLEKPRGWTILMSFFLDLQGSLTILRLSKNHCSPSGPLGPPRPLSFPSQALPGPLGLFQALRFTSAAYSQPYTVLIPPRSPQHVLRTTSRNLSTLQEALGLRASMFPSVPCPGPPGQPPHPQDRPRPLLRTSLPPRPLSIPSSPMAPSQAGVPGFPFRPLSALLGPERRTRTPGGLGPRPPSSTTARPLEPAAAS